MYYRLCTIIDAFSRNLYQQVFSSFYIEEITLGKGGGGLQETGRNMQLHAANLFKLFLDS